MSDDTIKRLQHAAHAVGKAPLTLGDVAMIRDACDEAVRAISECRQECEEQARVNGMGASREAALLAKLEGAKREISEIKKSHVLGDPMDRLRYVCARLEEITGPDIDSNAPVEKIARQAVWKHKRLVEYAELAVGVLREIRRELGFAEWGDNATGAAMFFEFIREWTAKIDATLATNPTPSDPLHGSATATVVNNGDAPGHSAALSPGSGDGGTGGYEYEIDRQWRECNRCGEKFQRPPEGYRWCQKCSSPDTRPLEQLEIGNSNVSGWGAAAATAKEVNRLDIGDERPLTRADRILAEHAGDAEELLAAECDQLEAELARHRLYPQPPEGWKLVPVEPTDDMVANIRRRQLAIRASLGAEPSMDDRWVYRAMIAAAPECPHAYPQPIKPDTGVPWCACPADVCRVDQRCYCRHTGAYNPEVSQTNSGTEKR